MEKYRKSNYIADQIIYKGILSKKHLNDSKTEKYKPSNYEEIINNDTYVNLGDMMYVKIVGIIDYNDVLSKYMSLKNIKYRLECSHNAKYIIRF